ncbi:hypothetical protein NP233_g10873 [Leucocoprinus birnbaumii]|uniref:Xylanolytic transcriptional activator regulatory domain-containing protein n=1 Tax=Leucocoprinus birnbaumii TaxID=56174 RepID=A0AAD5YKX8_9AGAR|nr:hypothetical protein NP233_g10873 [Leucocoprinus birnbaumii]
MSKAQKRSAGTARGPGSKIKCDGGKPSCETCINNGRQSECSYGKEPPRRPRTEAHFQAMLKDNEILREYIRLLESVLEQCSKEHPGSKAHKYLESRPANLEEIPESPEEVVNEVVEEEEEGQDDNDVAKELCLPTQNLRLGEEGGLLLHGGTAPFRYISEPMPPRPSISRLWAVTENPAETYTLLVDGTDEGHFNPHFDWSRHLPTEVHLDRREHDKLLDLIFKFFTSWCLRLIPALFLRDMYRALSVPKNQTPPRLSHYSPMLHNALLALGTAFSDDPDIRDLKARMYFLEKAKGYMEDECSRPHLCVVNALSLIGSFHSSQGDPTLGYVFFGMSARVGQALGLGVDCSSWVQTGYITAEDQIDRNWVYWTTFCQDVCWSLYVGREYCIPSISKTVPIPFTDADFEDMEWAGDQPSSALDAKAFGFTCKLLVITKSIMDVVNALDGPGNRLMILDPKISEIDVALHDWDSKLPDELKNSSKMRQDPNPTLLQLHLTFEWSFILLHRPFFKRRSTRTVIRENTIEHAKICQRAADNTMLLLEAWKKHYTFRYASITLIQTIFAAGTIYLLSALQAVEGTRIAKSQLRQAMENTLLCIDYLKEIGSSWPCATTIAGILKNWMFATKPNIRQRIPDTLSPFSSGILPPKPAAGLAQISARSSEGNGEKGEKVPTKRKSRNLGPSARKRQRNSSVSEEVATSVEDRVSGHQRTESMGSVVPPPPAPSIAINTVPGSNGAVTIPQAIPRSPLSSQGLQLPTPPAAPSPLSSYSPKPDRPSPQPPRSSPFGGHSPSAVVNGLPHTRTSPPRHLQVRASSQHFVSMSPQPQPWPTLPENVGSSDTAMSDATLPVSVQEQIQSQSQSSNSSQGPAQSTPNSDPPPLPASGGDPNDPNGADSPDSFNHEVNLKALAKTSTLAPLFPHYHFWAPGAFNFQAPNPHTSPSTASGSTLPVGGITAAAAAAAEGATIGRPMSPNSYQLAMPNGQRLGEAPFLPFSMVLQDGVERDGDWDIGQEGDSGISALNELEFEFVRFGESGREGDVEMDGRGREGWEDLGGELREEEVQSWFGIVAGAES